MGSIKQQALRVIADLPEDTDIADIIERLYLLHKINRGLKQAEAGDKMTQDQARERMAKWLE